MRTRDRPSPYCQLSSAAVSLLRSNELPYTAADEAVIPRRWELFEDLLLLPADAFDSPIWHAVSARLWPLVADVFRVSRVARHGRIQSNDFRSPRLEMLFGTNTCVRKRENGIIYELDLAKSMFSAGNVTEKARMGKMNCKGETVVDLFAGIGYFTIPLLKAGAGMVYACEWNPDAVVALRKNLELNRVAERCEVRFGDNREVAPVGVADRVILGLIPSSELSWKTACGCLKETGGILHIHANVDTPRNDDNFGHAVSVSLQPSCKKRQKERFEGFGRQVLVSLLELCAQLRPTDQWSGSLLHFECVKSYGPNVFHCVFDVELRPNRNK